MDILVNIVNQKLKIAANQKTLVEGTQKFIRFIFILPVEWKDLVVFAQFKQNDVGYNIFLDEYNAAYLPPEIVTGTCVLTIYGTRDDVVAVSDSVELSITRSGIVHDTQNTEISKSLYAQIMDRIDVMEFYQTWMEF